jgi:hypothetical protein
MYVKVYEYHIKPEMEREFIKLQAEAEKIYSEHIEKQSIFLKSKEDSSKWIEMIFYQDENRYNECIKVIDHHEKIQNLYAIFLSLIVSKTEVTEGNYEQVFVNV